jgi:hypothetical protein
MQKYFSFCKIREKVFDVVIFNVCYSWWMSSFIIVVFVAGVGGTTAVASGFTP